MNALSLDLHALDALSAILVIPAVAAAVLALVPGYLLGSRLNVLAALLTLVASLLLLSPDRPEPGRYLFIDDLNVVFIVLTTFIGFTTSVFSATYIAHELEIGRLTPQYLRFYHSMYQVLMFAMNLALSANNIGLMWVAIDSPRSPPSSWSASTAPTKPSRRHGNTSSWPASASRSPCSAPS